jgi:transcriptional regulator with XRE-family HTH domain
MDNTHRVLAILMKDQGLNQVELARATGIRQSTISRILNPGAVNGIKLPSDTQVRPVAAFFGVSTDQLRGYEVLRDAQTAPVTLDSPADNLLQHLRNIDDPQVLDAVTHLAQLFAEGHLSKADARRITELAMQLAAPKPEKAAPHDEGLSAPAL